MDGWWDSEPADTPRVTGKVKKRIQKLTALGNSIVPHVAYEIIKHIESIKE